MTAALWIAAAIALTAGAALADDPVRMPTADQVAAYVRDSWRNEYALRFSRLSGESREADLLSVKDVTCRDYFGRPDCSFLITAGLADGRERSLPMSATFEWTREGSLEEVIVLIHERKAGR